VAYKSSGSKPYSFTNSLTVGGVAQWLGRRSLAGGHFAALRPIYGGLMATLWVNSPLWVSQPGQLSLPFLRGR